MIEISLLRDKKLEMADWKNLTLRDISSDLQTGPFGSQLHAEEYVDEGIPVIMPTNIKSGRIDYKDAVKITVEKYMELKKHILKDGDVVFSRRGDVSKAAVVFGDAPAICGTGCLRARINSEKASSKFIGLLIQGKEVKDWLVDNAVGQTMPNMNTTILGNLPLKLPPLPEQQKIAEILGTWDTAIEQLETLIEKKQLLKRGLMQKLLTGKVRFREFEGEWETKTFQEITQINPRTDDWSGVFVGMEDVSEDGVLVTLNRLDISADFKTTGYSSFMDGDTLIAKITPCFENGKGAFVNGIGGGALGSTEFHVLRPNANMHPQYIYYQTRTYSFRQKGESSMQGSGGQQRVPTDFIRKYSIGIPKFDEQQRIVSVLENLDSEISILGQQLQALKTQKLGLMQQLLTGKRRVEVAGS